MQHQANQLFKPRAGERPLYPVALLDDATDVQAAEVVRWGGVPFVRTADGWAVCEHVAPRGTVETED